MKAYINDKNNLWLCTFNIVILCLALSIFPQMPGQADTSIIFIPPRGGAPKDTRGTASRGDSNCSENSTDRVQRLMALAPNGSHNGFTLSERPTLFVYVPPTSARQALFAVKDETGKLHYQSILPLTGDEGAIGLTLPPTAPPLEINKRYQWGFAILCSGQLKPDSPFVSIWIQRTQQNPNLTSQLQRSSEIERAALYASNGVWYDMLKTLAELKQQHPQDKSLAATWERLLESVGLSEISSKPLVSN